MGAMGYQMLIEDVLEKNFEHPHIAVGLILIMFYLVETMCPKGVSRPMGTTRDEALGSPNLTRFSPITVSVPCSRLYSTLYPLQYPHLQPTESIIMDSERIPYIIIVMVGESNDNRHKEKSDF